MRDKIALCVGEAAGGRFNQPLRDAMINITLLIASELRKHNIRCMRIYAPREAKSVREKMQNYRVLSDGANEWGADALLCIDVSDDGKGRKRGFQTWYNTPGGDSELLATMIYDNLYYERTKHELGFLKREGLGIKKMSAWTDRSIIMRSAYMPSTIADLGHFKNTQDREYIIKNQSTLADALVSGVREWSHSEVHRILRNFNTLETKKHDIV